MSYTTEESRLNAILSLAKGDYNEVISFILDGMYNKETALSDPDVLIGLINLVKNNEQELEKFYQSFRHEININSIVSLKSPQNIKKDEKFWGNKHEEKILLFVLFQYLNDDQLSDLFQNSRFYDLDINASLEYREKLLIKCYNQKLYKTLDAIRQNYYFFNDLENHPPKKYDKKSEEEINLSNYCLELSKDDIGLLSAHSDMFCSYFKDNVKKWIDKRIFSEKKDDEEFKDESQNILELKNFINIYLKDMPIENQEFFIACLANYSPSILEESIQTCFGVALKDYKPKNYPVWSEFSDNHSLENLQYLLENNITESDCFQGSGGYRFFINEVESNSNLISVDECFEKKVLNKNKLFDSFINEKIKIGDKEISKFAIISESYTSQLDLFKLNLEHIEDLGFISFKFKDKIYENLSSLEKLDCIDILLSKTWFSNAYCSETSYYKKSFEENDTVLDFCYKSGKRSYYDIWILSEHLNLMEKNSIENSKYALKYFNFAKTVIKQTRLAYVGEDDSRYKFIMKIIDSISTCKDLPWNVLSEETSKAVELSKDLEYSSIKNVCKYVQNIHLHHCLQIKEAGNKKKIKI